MLRSHTTCVPGCLAVLMLAGTGGGVAQAQLAGDAFVRVMHTDEVRDGLVYAGEDASGVNNLGDVALMVMTAEATPRSSLALCDADGCVRVLSVGEAMPEGGVFDRMILGQYSPNASGRGAITDGGELLFFGAGTGGVGAFAGGADGVRAVVMRGEFAMNVPAVTQTAMLRGASKGNGFAFEADVGITTTPSGVLFGFFGVDRGGVVENFQVTAFSPTPGSNVGRATVECVNGVGTMVVVGQDFPPPLFESATTYFVGVPGAYTRLVGDRDELNLFAGRWRADLSGGLILPWGQRRATLAENGRVVMTVPLRSDSNARAIATLSWLGGKQEVLWNDGDQVGLPWNEDVGSASIATAAFGAADRLVLSGSFGCIDPPPESGSACNGVIWLDGVTERSTLAGPRMPVAWAPGATLDGAVNAHAAKDQGLVVFEGLYRDASGALCVAIIAADVDAAGGELWRRGRLMARTGQAFVEHGAPARVISSLHLFGVSNGGVVTARVSFADGATGLYQFVVPAECAADVTRDTQVDSGDLQAFITAFLAGGPAADLTGDGAVDSGDLELFISAFLTGC